MGWTRVPRLGPATNRSDISTGERPRLLAFINNPPLGCANFAPTPGRTPSQNALQGRAKPLPLDGYELHDRALILSPALDANYQAVKTNAYSWPPSDRCHK